MVVNNDVGILDARGALGFFASVLAPTGGRGCSQILWMAQINCRSEQARDDG